MKKSQHPLKCCDFELLDKWEFTEEVGMNFKPCK